MNPRHLPQAIRKYTSFSSQLRPSYLRGRYKFYLCTEASITMDCTQDGHAGPTERTVQHIQIHAIQRRVRYVWKEEIRLSCRGYCRLFSSVFKSMRQGALSGFQVF